MDLRRLWSMCSTSALRSLCKKLWRCTKRMPDQAACPHPPKIGPTDPMGQYIQYGADGGMVVVQRAGGFGCMQDANWVILGFRSHKCKPFFLGTRSSDFGPSKPQSTPFVITTGTGYGYLHSLSTLRIHSQEGGISHGTLLDKS